MTSLSLSSGGTPDTGNKPVSPELRWGEFFTAEQPGKQQLVIREMQIKTTMRYHFTSIRITIIFKVKKKKERKITSIGKDVRK